MGGLLKNWTIQWVSRLAEGVSLWSYESYFTHDCYHFLSTLTRFTTHLMIQFSPLEENDLQY
jgi:hypothetical protein